jgi:DNA-binding response OmpR family regulator
VPRAHVLVVDDEPSILTTLQKALSLEGYGVDVAGGVKVAEEKLKKRSYDLCLFDVALPDGTGLDLLKNTRDAKVEVPVIMPMPWGEDRVATIEATIDAVTT